MKKNESVGRALTSMLLVGSAFVWTMPALAQDGTGASVAEESSSATAQSDNEIVVTALRRETTLQDTPLAITAVTGETLANASITDAYQLTRVSPGLVIRESANGGARITLRNINSSGEPVVGLYYDETPLIGPVGVNNSAGSSNPDVRLFDVERVEVLRGPQGTLYGSASMAGTVRLIFSKPNLSEAEGAFQGMLTTIDGGDVGYEAQAMVNAPIVQDYIGVRLVGFYRDRGGWIDNSVRGLKNINGAETYGGRLMLRIKPSDDTTIDGMAYIQRYNGLVNNWLFGTTTGGRNPVNYDAAWDGLNSNSDEMDLFSGTFTHNFGFATLSGTLSHQRRFLTYTADSSLFFRQQQANPTRCREYIGLPTGTACSAAQLEQYRTYALSQSPSAAFSEQDTRADTQEIRLASNGTSWFDWALGFFNSTRDADIHSDITLVDPATGLVIFPQTTTPRTANGVVVSPANVIFRRTITDSLKQTAGFGEVTARPIDGLELTAGARYYNYKREVTGAGVIGNIIVGTAATPAETRLSEDSGWVFKFNASYRFSPDVMVYAEASEGFRPGGVNQVIGLPQALGPYSSDGLWNYELGVKTQWFDRMLTANINVYQIDWTDMQISGQTNAQSTGSTFSFISNAGNARIRGIEFELSANPLEGLTLRASGSYNDAKLTTDQVSNVLTSTGKKGDKITGVPDVTLQGGAEYKSSLSDKLDGLARFDIAYTGPQWASFARTEANRLLNYFPGYTEVSARAGIESPDGDWGVYVFGNNLLNEVGLSSKTAGTTFGSGIIRGMAIVPRTYGLELRKRF